MNIRQFSEKIINGPGGLHAYEYHEMAEPVGDRDVAVAVWVIKCLSNPKCEGSEVAIQAILERRNKLAAEQYMHPTGGTCPVCENDRLNGYPCPNLDVAPQWRCKCGWANFENVRLCSACGTQRR